MTDRERFEEAWHTFQPKILAYFRGHLLSEADAEDLTSEVFRKGWENLRKNTDTSLSSYLYVISRNILTDYYRTRKLTVPLEMCEPVTEDITEQLIRTEMLSELAKSLDALPEKHKEIIVLHYYAGLSLTEISVKIGISYSLTKRYHKSALMKLRELEVK